MPSKKRVHLQQFGIIHLPNTDLTYIRNSERNKKFFMSFHLLETYIRNPSLFFISFFHPPTYARGEVSFAKFLFLPSWFAKLKAIFLVLPKSYGCQVDLPNCRSCSDSPRVVYRQPPRWQRLWAVAGVKVQSMEKKQKVLYENADDYQK
jgi:hypothetical protein